MAVRLATMVAIGALVIIAGRIVVGAHYVNDLIAAFYVALLSFWAIRLLFARYDLRIVSRPPQQSA